MDSQMTGYGANRLIASDRVEGTLVYNIQRQKLGSIAHIMIDKKSGRSEYAVMEFGGILGLGTDHYPIPWDMLTYDVEQGGYVVDIDKQRLTDAPRHATEETPEYTDEYGRTIYGYYGISYPLI